MIYEYAYKYDMICDLLKERKYILKEVIILTDVLYFS